MLESSALFTEFKALLIQKGLGASVFSNYTIELYLIPDTINGGDSLQYLEANDATINDTFAEDFGASVKYSVEIDSTGMITGSGQRTNFSYQSSYAVLVYRNKDTYLCAARYKLTNSIPENATVSFPVNGIHAIEYDIVSPRNIYSARSTSVIPEETSGSLLSTGIKTFLGKTWRMKLNISTPITVSELDTEIDVYPRLRDNVISISNFRGVELGILEFEVEAGTIPYGVSFYDGDTLAYQILATPGYEQSYTITDSKLSIQFIFNNVARLV